ncbi:MAG: hypothetical protein IJP93_12210 [Bacteroidales bacterium]|nr:hypothetical protein [Bacteroidales bacterium]MBR0084837.1 hypothetical protein [Bacteroidales bacterium]
MSISAGRYIKRFRNPHVRRLLEAVVDPRINALSLIYTLSTFDSGDSGYPEGGSLRMSQNMADTFTSLGGRILYRTPALGVRTDLSDCPRCMKIVLRRPLEAGGLKFDSITVNNYAREKEYAPEGCTTLTCILSGSSYYYWKAEREKGLYKQLKQEVIAEFISLIEEVLPQTRGLVEATDLATPLTWERYCDTFEGSYMSDWMPRHFSANALIRFLPDIYFTGQRTAFSGGLPVAAHSGWRTAQILCKDFGEEFIRK